MDLLPPKMVHIFKETHQIFSSLLLLMCFLQVLCQSCPDSFVDLGDSKYCYSRSARTFDNARTYCKNIGGDLPIITSEEQNELLAKGIPTPSNAQSRYRYWIGFRSNNDGVFEFINGMPPSYTNWISDPETGDCAYMIGSRHDIHGQWDRRFCTEFRRHMCQLVKALPLGSWAPLGDRLYYISEDWTARTYEDARAYCQNLGGDLAQPQSENINDILKGAGGSDEIWIGLDDINIEGTYQWVDGTLFEEGSSFWEPGHPIVGNSLNCVRLSQTGWIAQSCFVNLRFACEINQVLPAGSWVAFGSNTYFKSPSWLRLSFQDARNYCQGLGGDLAQPKNEQAHDFIKEILDANYWIGLSDTKVDGTYVWIDGTIQGDRFPSWASGAAPMNKNSDCVYIQTNAFWGVKNCINRLRFACEKSRVSEPVLPTRLTVVTSTPFGSDTKDSSYVCLLSPPDDIPSIQVTTQRLVKLNQAPTNNTLVVPGNNDAVTPDSLPVVINQTLPPDNSAMGVFECKATASIGTITTVSTVISLHSRIYQPADGRFTKSVYVGSNISLIVTKLDMDISPSLVTWKRFLDLDAVDSSLEESMGKLTHDVTLASSQDADVYGTLTSGDLSNHGQSFIRLIVIVCPRGRWDPPSCLGVCDNCYNGGICHQDSGTCTCPPGFSGKNCLTACGEHRYGWQCELECGPGYALDQCAGSQVCLPDPYGCNCLSGYTEIYCNETCQEGKFGVDCLQDCHCSLGSSCDPYTGSCSGGCEDEWSGPSCQVPSLCVQGYYGENCTEKCHCLDGRPCEKVTGSCLDSKGECAVGYIPDAEGTYDNCRLFSGCYDSCLSTCHCSGGAPDCNSVTGSCFSNNCSLRWTGEKCQTDRFSIESEKTNPGLALVHCSFSTIDQPLPSGGINIAHNDKIIDGTLMTSNYSTTDNASRVSFFIGSVGVDDILYCTFGLNLVTQRPLVYARAPEREYYVLPELASTPNISEVGVQHVLLTWRQWDPDSDMGDGPVIGYFIYIRTSETLVRIDWIPSPTSEPRRNKNSSFSVGQLTNETIHHNITNLESDTKYLLALSVVREGMNGEGSEGENIQVITLPIPTTAPPETQSFPPHTRGISQGNNATAIAAGSAVGALFVMVIVVIVIILIIRQRRRKNNGGKDDNPLHMHHSMYDNQEGVTFPGTDEVDGQEQVILPVVSLRKPNVPNKPLVHTVKPAHVPPKRTVTSLDKKPVSPVDSVAKLERIPVAEFPAFVQRNRHTSFFSEEFSSLPSGIQFRQTVAERPINMEKNRYKNILPYDSKRVILEPINDDPQTDYFNASYIPNFKNARAYIASQGPNKASVDDFWRMIWQEKVATIAMVTNLREGNKIKCKKYWPDDDNQAISFGQYHIQLTSLKEGHGWVVRHLQIQRDDECRSLRQFHYTEWPDKGVPRHTSSLLKFLREVQADHGQTEAPLLIHCSAGVGRTGVVIGIDGIVAEAKATGFVDVFNFVSTMRQNRPQMVQTSEQYEFLYGAVIEDLLFEDTSVPIQHFASHVRSLKGMIHRGGLTGLSKEFQNLQLLCPDPPESMYRSGLMPPNQSKNRYGNILPLQRNRVILQSQVSSEDYINASFVKGVYCNFITTEMPMSNTVSDFWAMIYDYQPKCIVMLNNKEEDKTCTQYWPEEGSVTRGFFTITVSSTTKKNDIIIRTLRVQNTKSSKSQELKQYQFLGWSKDTTYQDGGASSLLTLIDQVQETVDTEGYILVHCLNGVGRTGVFCTAMECIAQIAEEDTIDIFQTVKMLRVDRTHFVQTEADYANTYLLLLEYLCMKNFQQGALVTYNVEPTYGNTEQVYANTGPPYDNTKHQTANKYMPVSVSEEHHGESNTESLPNASSRQTEILYENVAFNLGEE